MLSGSHRYPRTIYRFKPLLLLILLSTFLTACGGGGGGGGSTAGTTGGNEGSINTTTGTVTPKIITDGYNGTVSTGVSYFKLTGYTPDTKYYVYLYDISSDISLTTHVLTYLAGWCSSDRAANSAEGCDVISNPDGSIYFSVDGSSTSSGASYKVAIYAESGSEGAGTPKDISALLPYRGSVDYNETSYYEIGGLIPGQNYTVSLTNILFPASLKTSPHKSAYITSTVAPVCASNNAEWADETCVQAANFEGKIYVTVSDESAGFDFDGSFYTISVAQTSGTGITFEGYFDAPVELTTLPYSSSTFAFSSQYKVSGLVAGQRYEVHLNNVDAGGADLNGADLNVNTGTDTGGSGCTEYTTATTTSFSGWCVGTATDSGNLYIGVGSAYNNPTSYQLDIAAAPIAEGSSTAPLAITSPYDGQTDIRFSDSYYVMSGLLPNWNYEIPFSNETRSIFLNTGSSTGTLLNGSTGRTNANGELYIRVSTSDDDGAWFTLNNPVVANNPEGTVSPLDISAATEANPHHGQVDDTQSYYVVSGLTPGKYYMTHMRGVEVGYGSINAYSSSAFDFASRICLGSSFQTNEQGTCLAPANASGELFITAEAGWDITGSTYDIWTLESLISTEGEDVLPMDITGGINSGLSVTHAGQVSTYNRSSYYKLVLTSLGTANYTVSLGNMTGNVDLEVWNAITGSTDSCLSKRNHLLDESCVIQSQTVGGSVKSVDIYVKVSVVNSYSDHWDGATFDLTVTPGGILPVSEGSAITPLDVTGQLPYVGKTNGSAMNYYTLTGLDSGSQYEISTTNDLYGLETFVYSDAALSTQLCSARNIEPSRNETKRLACKTFPNASGEFYITLDSGSFPNSSSDSFTLNVTAAPVAEGSLSVPVGIVGTGIRASQVNGVVDINGDYTAGTVNSYYVVSGLTPGAVYMAHTTNATETVDLYIYNDAGFSVAECDSSNTFVQQCVFTVNSAGQAYIHADGFVWSGASGSFFDLHINELPVTEGSLSTPVVITAGTTHFGQQGGYQKGSYYKVSGLIPNSTHRVMIRNQSAATPLSIYSEASLSYMVCDINGDEVQSGCSVGANAAGEIYIKTESSTTTDDAATLYELYVTP